MSSITNKIRTKYFRVKQWLYQKRHSDAPWLVPKSIEIINQLIKPSDIGIEFGSGRSTLWLANRCRFLHSREHNRSWFDTVTNNLKGRSNVDYQFSEVTHENDSAAYLKIFDETPPDSIDFILNDGKFRGDVSEIGIEKLKRGGFLIIDNAERYLPNPFPTFESILNRNPSEKWAAIRSQTVDWRRLWHSDGISSTLILFKP